MHWNKNKFIRSSALLLAALVLTFSVSIPARVVQADGSFICAPSDTTVSDVDSTSGDLYNCVSRIYTFSVIAASIAAVFMIVLAGYFYMFSGGSEERTGTAKSLISTSIGGLIILLGGLLILKQINPSLLKLKSISPQQIASRDWTYIGYSGSSGNTSGGGGYSGGSGIGGDNSGPAGHKASELQCSFQGNKANQVPNLTEALFQAVRTICAQVKAQGLTAQISSITSGSHAPNSLHYRGCALDFAGGDANYVNHPTGQAVINAAKSLGLVINPGPDAKQTFHIHVDVGDRNCKAPRIPDSKRG